MKAELSHGARHSRRTMSNIASKAGRDDFAGTGLPFGYACLGAQQLRAPMNDSLGNAALRQHSHMCCAAHSG
jgi:hypothetical protein